MNRTQPKAARLSPLAIYKLATAALMLTIAIFGLIAFLAFFKNDSRYFDSSVPKVILYAALALGALLAVSAFFASKKIGKIVSAQKTPAILSLMPAGAALAALAVSIIEMTKGNKTSLSLAITVSLLGVAFYHLSSLLKLPSPLKLALGYVRIAFCVILIAKLHLDFHVELNSPVKLLTQFSAATAMLCTLSELRDLLGRSSTGYFICSRVCFLAVSLLGAIGALTEVASNLDKYNIDLLIYPILFLASAIPTAVEFFSSEVSSKTDETDVDENNAE